MNLYHYYDKTIGPFKSLSDIDDEEANRILHNIAKCKPDTQCAKRTPDYMAKRRYYEDILRKEFQKKVELLNGFHHITWWWNKVSG